MTSPMGSQGLVSKTDGLNFALPLVVEAKKMMWKELKRRRGLLMTVGQRLFWSLGRSDLGGEGVTLPNISRPLFSSFTAPIHPLVSQTGARLGRDPRKKGNCAVA